MEENKKAIILSSGGLDSTTAMAVAKDNGFDLFSLSFDYGQRHRVELSAAKKIAEEMGVSRHLVINVNMRDIGGSALTDGVDVPKNNSFTDSLSDPLTDEDEEIPITYVPARNTIFLSFALAWAEVLGAEDIFIGVNAVDYSGYPDCRPEYIKAFQNMANLATKAGVEKKTKTHIQTPLIHMTKAEIIRLGVSLGVDYSLTHSCYDPSPDGKSCGECDSCILRKKGFKEAGIKDPITYIR